MYRCANNYTMVVNLGYQSDCFWNQAGIFLSRLIEMRRCAPTVDGILWCQPRKINRRGKSCFSQEFIHWCKFTYSLATIAAFLYWHLDWFLQAAYINWRPPASETLHGLQHQIRTPETTSLENRANTGLYASLIWVRHWWTAKKVSFKPIKPTLIYIHFIAFLLC